MTRLARTLSCAIAVATATTFAATLPASAAEPGTDYVALGDSYSSGVGTGDYIDGSGGCKRSTDAYPELWASAHGAVSLHFAACSGATTGDVTADQLDALSASTDLVTITIGGNDAGFTHVMLTCVIGSVGGPGACQDATEDAIDYVHDTLPGKLDATYAAIEQDAPNAEVVVLGYPRLYTLDGSCNIGIGDTARQYVNDAADELDETIAKRAANAGFEFVDVRDAFAGHGICSSDWWLNSTTWPLSDSYHPNKQGHRDGYLPALERVAPAIAGAATVS